jgi:general secretion pathway protein C
LDEIYRDHVVLVKGTRHTTLYIEGAGAPTDTGAGDALAMVGGVATNVESPHLSVEPITDYLRPVPVYRDNVIAGFQVYPGARPALFSKWGLQPGDLMTELDGQPVADADQLMQMLSGLIDGQALAATVQRGAATLSVTLDGAEVERLQAASNRPLPAPITP